MSGWRACVQEVCANELAYTTIMSPAQQTAAAATGGGGGGGGGSAGPCHYWTLAPSPLFAAAATGSAASVGQPSPAQFCSPAAPIYYQVISV